MLHRDHIALKKISDELVVALEFIDNVALEDFLENELLKHAAGMAAINIGELVKNLSMDFRAEHDYIPWKQISGFRDITAHKYGTLDMSYVYNTITRDFPLLKTQIQEILENE